MVKRNLRSTRTEEFQRKVADKMKVKRKENYESKKKGQRKDTTLSQTKRILPRKGDSKMKNKLIDKKDEPPKKKLKKNIANTDFKSKKESIKCKLRSKKTTHSFDSKIPLKMNAVKCKSTSLKTGSETDESEDESVVERKILRSSSKMINSNLIVRSSQSKNTRNGIASKARELAKFRKQKSVNDKKKPNSWQGDKTEAKDKKTNGRTAEIHSTSTSIKGKKSEHTIKVETIGKIPKKSKMVEGINSTKQLRNHAKRVEKKLPVVPSVNANKQRHDSTQDKHKSETKVGNVPSHNYRHTRNDIIIYNHKIKGLGIWNSDGTITPLKKFRANVDKNTSESKKELPTTSHNYRYINDHNDVIVYDRKIESLGIQNDDGTITPLKKCHTNTSLEGKKKKDASLEDNKMKDASLKLTKLSLPIKQEPKQRFLSNKRKRTDDSDSNAEERKKTLFEEIAEYQHKVSGPRSFRNRKTVDYTEITGTQKDMSDDDDISDEESSSSEISSSDSNDVILISSSDDEKIDNSDAPYVKINRLPEVYLKTKAASTSSKPSNTKTANKKELKIMLCAKSVKKVIKVIKSKEELEREKREKENTTKREELQRLKNQLQWKEEQLVEYDDLKEQIEEMKTKIEMLSGGSHTPFRQSSKSTKTMVDQTIKRKVVVNIDDEIKCVEEELKQKEVRLEDMDKLTDESMELKAKLHELENTKEKQRCIENTEEQEKNRDLHQMMTENAIKQMNESSVRQEKLEGERKLYEKEQTRLRLALQQQKLYMQEEMKKIKPLYPMLTANVPYSSVAGSSSSKSDGRSTSHMSGSGLLNIGQPALSNVAGPGLSNVKWPRLSTVGRPHHAFTVHSEPSSGIQTVYPNMFGFPPIKPNTMPHSSAEMVALASANRMLNDMLGSVLEQYKMPAAQYQDIPANKNYIDKTQTNDNFDKVPKTQFDKLDGEVMNINSDSEDIKVISAETSEPEIGKASNTENLDSKNKIETFSENCSNSTVKIGSPKIENDDGNVIATRPGINNMNSKDEATVENHSANKTTEEIGKDDKETKAEESGMDESDTTESECHSEDDTKKIKRTLRCNTKNPGKETLKIPVKKKTNKKANVKKSEEEQETSDEESESDAHEDEIPQRITRSKDKARTEDIAQMKNKEKINKKDDKKSSEGRKKEKKTKSERREIKGLMKKRELTKETKEAEKKEKKRLNRLADIKEKHTRIEESGKSKESPITTKLVLESDSNGDPMIEVNSKLIKKLKPHQVDAVEFMWDSCIESLQDLSSQEKEGGGCILAHCMGLGKSLAAITFVHTLLSQKKVTNQRTCLVVCPLNTVLNWEHEWMKWLDKKDRLHVYEMTSVKKNKERAQMLNKWDEKGGVLITGYAMFRRLANSKTRSKKMKEIFQRTLLAPGPDIVICDEGHILKNDATSISKSLNKIRTKRRIVLTGTPLQNNLIEYHCMANFVKPSLLGTKKEFANRFVNPITNGQCRDATTYDVKLMQRRAHVLHNILEGTVQRRDYSALTKFLPPKYEYILSVRLAPKQVELYQKYLDRTGKGSGEIAMGSIVGARLFQDYHNLSRIWTHPWLLKLDAVRQAKKDTYDSDESFYETTDDSESEEEPVRKAKKTAYKKDKVITDLLSKNKTKASTTKAYEAAPLKTENEVVELSSDEEISDESIVLDDTSESEKSIQEISSDEFEDSMDEEDEVDESSSIDTISLSSDFSSTATSSTTSANLNVRNARQKLQKSLRDKVIETQAVRKINSEKLNGKKKGAEEMVDEVLIDEKKNNSDCEVIGGEEQCSKEMLKVPSENTDINRSNPSSLKEPKANTEKALRESKVYVNDENRRRIHGELVRGWTSRRRSGFALLEPVVQKEPPPPWWSTYVNEEDEYDLHLAGKLVLMMDILKIAYLQQEKVLLFSQSLLALDLIESFLAKMTESVKEESSSTKKKYHPGRWEKNEDYYRLDGSTQAHFRKRWTQGFRDPQNPRSRLFIISTKAGSLGINLESANRVIMFDCSWNPSHDVQSIFRVYRFGQKKSVFIYRLLAQGTMEEKIYERQVTKLSLSQRVVDEQQIVRHFTAADLQELYVFTPDRLDDPNKKERPTPKLPKDELLADLLINRKEWIVQYHEHDSLLENQVDQELSEEERKAAWEEYEAEKMGLTKEANILPYTVPLQQTTHTWQQHQHIWQPHVSPNLPELGRIQYLNVRGQIMLTRFRSQLQSQLPIIVSAILKHNPGINMHEVQCRLQNFLKTQLQNHTQTILRHNSVLNSSSQQTHQEEWDALP